MAAPHPHGDPGGLYQWPFDQWQRDGLCGCSQASCSRLRSWIGSALVNRPQRKHPNKRPSALLRTNFQFGHTCRRDPFTMDIQVIAEFSPVFRWSGRRDCVAIYARKLASSNPGCGMRRIAVARLISNPSFLPVVGAEGFEPPTLCSQSRCASQAALRPVTKRMAKCITLRPPVNADFY